MSTLDIFVAAADPFVCFPFGWSDEDKDVDGRESEAYGGDGQVGPDGRDPKGVDGLEVKLCAKVPNFYLF